MRFLLSAIILSLTLSLMSCNGDAESHWDKMTRAQNEMLTNRKVEGRFVSYDIDKRIERKYHRHRQWLVENGILFNKTFEFKHVYSATPSASSIFRELLTNPPKVVIDYESDYSEGKKLRITLWGMENDRAYWNDFFKLKDKEAQQVDAAGPAVAGP